MKCVCQRCQGEGRIPCPDCDDGTFDLARHASPEAKKIIAELDVDLNRVRRQSLELAALMPHNAVRYGEQLDAIVAVIHKQAEDAKRMHP